MQTGDVSSVAGMARTHLKAFLLLLLSAELAHAAGSAKPEGTKGWWYYIDIYSEGGYADTPEEACRKTAKNHLGTWLLDMRPDPYGGGLIDCAYPHFIKAAGWWWYGTTQLACETGYKPTPEGICAKITAPPPSLSCQPGTSGYALGNPVIVATGAKVQRERDRFGSVSNTLDITRTYRTFNSSWKSSSGGSVWFFWFDRSFKITLRSSTDGRPLVIEGTLGDGTYFKFTWNALTRRYDSSLDYMATLEPLDSAFGEWLLVQNGHAEHFKRKTAGTADAFVMLSSQALDGPAQFFTYDPDSLLLQEVTDDRGRKLDISWGPNRQVASISGPEGKVLYNYDSPWGDYPSFGGHARLISVDYADIAGLILSSRRYHYEDANNPFLLTGITDENGQRYATYTYDGNGRALSSEHANGSYRYTFAYPDANTRIVTDPLGSLRTINLQYVNKTGLTSGIGLASGESQPGGAGCTPGSQTINHDLQGNISSQTDFNGNKTCYQYNARGLVSSRVEGLASSDACPVNNIGALPRSDARRTTTAWHPDFPLQTIVARPKHVTAYVYNGQPDASGKVAECAPGAVLANGQPLPLLCSITEQATSDASGNAGLTAQRIGAARVWNYSYDANGRMLQSLAPADANGRRATTAYAYYQDSSATHYAGDLSSMTNAAGQVTEYLEYSLGGQPALIRMPNGATMSARYGSDQSLLTMTLDAGDGTVERSEFEYDAVGNLTRVTSPDGSSLSYAYDAAHRMTDTVDSAGNREHHDLDGLGNIVGEQVYDSTGTLAFKLTRSFDALNRLQREQRALQQTGTAFEYDRHGNLTKLTDPQGRVTSRQYDGLNRLAHEQLPGASSSSPHPTIDYTYDHEDHALSIRDPNGYTTRYTVDGFGQRTALSSPDTGASSYSFDGAGNLVSRTDAKGVVTKYSYDAVRHMLGLSVAGSPTKVTSYEYGAPGTPGAGQLTAMHDDSGHSEFGYDGFGRLTSKVQTVTGATTRVFSVRYAYGATGPGTGHISSVTYPSGNRIEIGYDNAGRPASLTLLPSGATVPVPLVTDISYHPQGLISGWTWGNSTAAAPNKYNRNFDLEGKLVSYPLGHPERHGVLRTLHYDAAGRIIDTVHTGDARASTLNQVYYYDGLDRLTGFEGTATNQRYAYDMNGNRRQVSFGTASYTNTLSATSNRLLGTTGPAPAKNNTFDAAGNLLGDGTVRYTYTSRNQVETSTAAGITTRYLYNGRGERVFKTSSVGTTYYVYDEQGRLLGEYDSAGKSLQETIYLGALPVAVVKPGAFGPAIYYVYSDHLQAPRMLTRALDNQIVWRWDQADPFGLVQPDENPSGLGKFTYNLRFPGQVFDRETNNHYNYFRDYDPQTGRYNQSDPLGLLAGINPYTYVRGNPINDKDVLGLMGGRGFGQLVALPPPEKDCMEEELDERYGPFGAFLVKEFSLFSMLPSRENIEQAPVKSTATTIIGGYAKYQGYSYLAQSTDYLAQGLAKGIHAFGEFVGTPLIAASSAANIEVAGKCTCEKISDPTRRSRRHQYDGLNRSTAIPSGVLPGFW